MKHLTPVVLALGVLAGTAPAAFGEGGGKHTMVLPSELKWTDVPSLPPGAKLAVIEGPMNQAVPFTVRLKFPKDYQIPGHSHPAIERVTVLSGTFHMGAGDKFEKDKTHALPAGAIAIMQNGTNHFAWASDEVIVQGGPRHWGRISRPRQPPAPRRKAAGPLTRGD